MREMAAAPGVPAATQGRIYYDQADSEFKVSQGGGAYQPLGTGTVTSVDVGNGLQTTGAVPITTAGTIDLRLNANGSLSKALGGGADELGIDPMGAVAGQVLKWNGTKWAPGADAGAVPVAGPWFQCDLKVAPVF